MNRLAFALQCPAEIAQASTQLLDSEGLCACGRVMRRLDPKFILTNVVPTRLTIIVAAYCQPCSLAINGTLKGIHKVAYHGTTETAPIEKPMKKL